MAKALLWTVTVAEARKRGEQTGLDTLLFLVVYDVDLDVLALRRGFRIGRVKSTAWGVRSQD